MQHEVIVELDRSALHILEGGRSKLTALEAEAALVIVNAQDMELAGDIRRRAALGAKEMNDRRLELTRPIDDMKKRVMDAFRPTVDGFDAIEASLKGRMDKYAREERVRLEQEKRDAEKRAREAGEERRLKDLAAAIESGNTVAARSIEAAPVLVVDAANVPHAEAVARDLLLQQRAQKVEELIECGDIEGAKRLQAEPVPTVYAGAVIGPVPNGVKPTNYTATRKWKFEVVDAGQIPREFLMVNERALQAIADSLKGDAKVSGVNFYEEQGTRRR